MVNYFNGLKERILKKKVKIAVVGLGYVGLPLAVEFAKKGLNVVGIEIDKDRLRQIKRKESYIIDVPSEDLIMVLKKGRFSVSSDFKILKEVDVIIICVPTPLKRKYRPDISYIKQAVKRIAKNLRLGSLIILESTTYPGTTEEVILPLIEQEGLRHGRDFYLSFSPERIDPNNKDFPLKIIPKVVGGINKQATELTVLVYKNIIKKVVPVSSSRVAEATKLLENTFRLINIGFINELAMMCHKMNIDVWEVIEAASTKPFGFMRFYPGPGVGGHCIPKDPLYLYWKAKHFGFKSRFIKLASEVINYMPKYVVGRVVDLLKSKMQRRRRHKIKILVVGVTYKKDVKDLRKSPALDLIDILQKKGFFVSYYDPLIPYLKINHINLKSILLEKLKLVKFDCVIIATDHSSIDYDFILKNSALIFDTRNVYRQIRTDKLIRL
ncbi:MAG: nucleotide sugar dehydrogenase [Candidatus Omnitrophica bacterium]|nr:nucleotide sugar dehydrogenase [Candidatus Omnitrophota bacterium]